MRTVLLAVIMTTFTLGMNAQSKVGYANVDELLAAMPETKAAEEEMKKFAEILQNDMKFLEEEYQNKLTELENGANSGWSELMIKSKQEDLYNSQQKIYEFQQQAQTQISEKQVELMQPVIEKLQNAVNEVAKEKGFAYVLDASPSRGVVIYKDGGTDIAPFVKAKLGI
ncbi:MAG: OmpH family outer membrane protein [Schleiferiaceae bacterium]|jgi:outer membrane protein|nr:OmpH family outer membrane protein [Schleiferiaceae bacterium]